MDDSLELMETPKKRVNVKRIVLTVLAVLLVIAPLTGMLGFAVLSADVFDESPNAVLADKYERLYSIDEPKIVLISGSSMAYGMDSELLSELTGMPVVNFGLYASLGSKLMLDLSRNAIGEGDIIVFAPETDSQAYSMYFSAKNTLQALDAKPSMIFDIGTDSYSSLWGGLWSHLESKLDYYSKGGKPDVSKTAMRRENFNEYGDLLCEFTLGDKTVIRNTNTMLGGYDRTTPIVLSKTIVEDAFVNFFNDYVKEVEKKGATVYFSFSPMNQRAIVSLDLEEIPKSGFSKVEDSVIRSYCDTFAEDLEGLFDCEFISDPYDYILDKSYFYDTNFHLTQDGIAIRTNLLANDILSAIQKENK